MRQRYTVTDIIKLCAIDLGYFPTRTMFSNLIGENLELTEAFYLRMQTIGNYLISNVPRWIKGDYTSDDDGTLHGICVAVYGEDFMSAQSDPHGIYANVATSLVLLGRDAELIKPIKCDNRVLIDDLTTRIHHAKLTNLIDFVNTTTNTAAEIDVVEQKHGHDDNRDHLLDATYEFSIQTLNMILRNAADIKNYIAVISNEMTSTEPSKDIVALNTVRSLDGINYLSNLAHCLKTILVALHEHTQKK